MASDVTLILLYTRQTLNSINALVGAVESGREFASVEVRLPRNFGELRAELGRLAGAGKGVRSLFPRIQNVHPQDASASAGPPLGGGKRLLTPFPIVGVSLFTLQAGETAEQIGHIRREFGPRPLLLAGGPHPSADSLGVLQMGFDAVVPGEGERTLRDLLAAVRADADWRTVRGIAYLDAAGQLRRTPPQPPVALDEFAPFPVNRRKAGPIEITRGCPFACGFCQTTALLGGRVRHRGVASVAHWVEVMAARGPADVRVVTPNAFNYGSADGRSVNLAAIEELLAAMRRAAGPDNRIFFGSFPSEVRPEQVSPAALALVKRYADNDTMNIGAQSGSQRMLDLCRRGHTPADVVNAAGLILRAGLGVTVDFIFGLPGETEADQAATLALIRQLADLGNVRIRGHAFMPLPQTAFAGERPGRVSRPVREALGELQRAGKMEGLWWRQQRQAAEIARQRGSKA